LLAALISGLDVREVDHLAGRGGCIFAHAGKNSLLCVLVGRRRIGLHMIGGRFIFTRNSRSIIFLQRWQITLAGRGLVFRGLIFLRAYVHFFIGHLLTSLLME